MVGFAVPARAYTAIHPTASIDASPCSLNVGTIGDSGERSVPDVARIRTFPPAD